jgi:hypothetical protein
MWQPIETLEEAPRGEDGWPQFHKSRALLYGPSIGIHTGDAARIHGKPHVRIGGFTGDAAEQWGVTHWMPLPEPPK